MNRVIETEAPTIHKVIHEKTTKIFILKTDRDNLILAAVELKKAKIEPNYIKEMNLK